MHPIYLPVLADAAEGATPWGTVVAHYQQIRRWAWGASDVPYVGARPGRERRRALAARDRCSASSRTT